jgi:hypothetical protein
LYLNASKVATSGSALTFDGSSMVLDTSTSSTALRITQRGTGDALLVEDSTNPDSTPFVIDASGRIIQGYTTAILTADDYNGSTRTGWGYQGNGTGPAGALFTSWNVSSAVGAGISLSRSKSATIGTQGVVASGDSLGGIGFNGDDGTNFIVAASITSAVDGTPGTNDMPGRLLLSTTPDGSDTPVERVRITSAGKTGFATSAPAATVHVAGDTILSNVNVLGASYDSVSFSVAGQETTPTDLFFSPDGLKMYVIGSVGDDVNEYNLSTAWVVSSAVFVTNFSVASQENAPSGLFFRADGTKMYIVGQTNDTVFQYTLSTPWSIATASYDSISFSVAAEATPNGLFFKPNGLSMYMVGSTGDAVYQYTLSTAWNVSTATFLQSFSVFGQESQPNAVTFTADGSRMFVMGQTGDDVNVYNLTTPWDISTLAFVNVFSVAGQDTTPQGIYIKPDGTKMYILGSTNDTVFQYTVPSIDIQLTGPTSAAALTVQQDLTVYGTTAISGTVTLNGGTANGVAYLNGSKVATSGSALTFDGTNFINTAGYLGTTQSGATSSYYIAKNSAASSGVVFGAHSSGAGYIDVINNNPLFFAVNDTEQMRLTSTGLGIGTSSPATKLDVSGQITTRGSVGAFVAQPRDGSGAEWSIYNPTGDDLRFFGNSDDRMVLTNSGNLGLGVTPSAWSSFTALQFGETGCVASNAFSSSNTQTLFGNNLYYDGAYRYIATGSAAAQYIQIGDEHRWLTAPSGTAGNAITFTQALTLDASGNLLVGATTNVANERLNATKSVADYVVRFINSNATPYGLVLNHSAASPNGTGNEFLRCVDSTSTDRMTVRSNGGIANYSANNVNLSDRREKTNFSPAKSYLDTICAIPVQTFNYIDQSENDPGLTLGVVAQDVQAVAPELVMESNWGTKEEPKMRLSIYQTDLQYALMKCIQEQQALITSLTARVAALEGTQP